MIIHSPWSSVKHIPLPTNTRLYCQRERPQQGLKSKGSRPTEGALGFSKLMPTLETWPEEPGAGPESADEAKLQRVSCSGATGHSSPST